MGVWYDVFVGYGSFIWVAYFGRYSMISLGHMVLFGGYGSFIWGVWYDLLRGMVVIIGGYGTSVLGYDTTIWGVWYFYIGVWL